MQEYGETVTCRYFQESQKMSIIGTKVAWIFKIIIYKLLLWSYLQLRNTLLYFIIYSIKIFKPFSLLGFCWCISLIRNTDYKDYFLLRFEKKIRLFLLNKNQIQIKKMLFKNLSILLAILFVATEAAPIPGIHFEGAKLLALKFDSTDSESSN